MFKRNTNIFAIHHVFSKPSCKMLNILVLDSTFLRFNILKFSHVSKKFSCEMLYFRIFFLYLRIFMLMWKEKKHRNVEMEILVLRDFMRADCEIPPRRIFKTFKNFQGQ